MITGIKFLKATNHFFLRRVLIEKTRREGLRCLDTFLQIGLAFLKKNKLISWTKRLETWAIWSTTAVVG
jgi:hypothetical protein